MVDKAHEHHIGENRPTALEGVWISWVITSVSGFLIGLLAGWLLWG